MPDKSTKSQITKMPRMTKIQTDALFMDFGKQFGSISGQDVPGNVLECQESSKEALRTF